MPKFKTESIHRNLDRALKSFGLETMFESNAADFSGMSSEKVWVESVLQKASVKVWSLRIGVGNCGLESDLLIWFTDWFNAFIKCYKRRIILSKSTLLVRRQENGTRYTPECWLAWPFYWVCHWMCRCNNPGETIHCWLSISLCSDRQKWQFGICWRLSWQLVLIRPGRMCIQVKSQSRYR